MSFYALRHLQAIMEQVPMMMMFAEPSGFPSRVTLPVTVAEMGSAAAEAEPTASASKRAMHANMGVQS